MGTWRSLREPDYCVLGGECLGSHHAGFGAVVGDEIWDQRSRVRLKLGPLTQAQYRNFLPTGPAWPELRAMLRSFCGNDLEFEIQLILRREDGAGVRVAQPARKALCAWAGKPG